MGQIQYTTIVDNACCGGADKEYNIPFGATPHEIAEITGMSIHKALELYEKAIEEDNEKCPTIYLSEQISKSLQKNNCQYGTGSFVTVTIPAGKYSSQLSQLDANRKAQDEFDKTAQEIANDLGSCITDCNSSNCPSEIVKRTKPCGEYRRKQECRNGQCVEFGEEFFVCTGNCSNEVCIENCDTCSTVCPTGSCPANHTCINGVCIPDCDGQPCSRLCRNGTCPAGSICVDGACTEIPEDCTACSSLCPTGSCPSGQTCVNGICTPNCTGQPCSRQCRNGDCPPCFKCEDGECVGPKCSSNQKLNETTCRCEGIPCEPPCSTVEQVNECNTRTIQQRCVAGNCVDGTSTVVNQPDGTPCGDGTTQACLNGTCIDLPCEDEGNSCSPGSVNCCDGLACINGTCQEAFPADTNLVVVYDTTSLGNRAKNYIKTTLIDPFIADLRLNFPNWTGTLSEFDQGLNSSYPERWVGYQNLAKPIGKSIVLLSFLDESNGTNGYNHGIQEPADFTLNSIPGTSQPNINYTNDYNQMVSDYDNYYKYFKGILYAAPGRSLTEVNGVPDGSYANLHLQGYAAVEGTTITATNFIPSAYGDISIIQTENPYQALGPGLKNYGWGEVHNFTNGVESLTYAEFKAQVEPLIFG